MSIKTHTFAGLSDDQVANILRQIANQADLMANICREQAELTQESGTANTFQSLNAMLCGLGALADMPIGGAVVGDFADWMLGPLFSLKQEADL